MKIGCIEWSKLTLQAALPDAQGTARQHRERLRYFPLMLRQRAGQQLALLGCGQSCKPHKDDTGMNETLSKHQFSEVLVFVTSSAFRSFASASTVSSPIPGFISATASTS